MSMDASPAASRRASCSRWDAASRRWLCLLHDASAARRSESEARAQAALFRLLADNVPVLIAYGTTLVKAGRTYFFEDIYGLDRLLNAALRQRPVVARTIH